MRQGGESLRNVPGIESECHGIKKMQENLAEVQKRSAKTMKRREIEAAKQRMLH